MFCCKCILVMLIAHCIFINYKLVSSNIIKVLICCYDIRRKTMIRNGMNKLFLLMGTYITKYRAKNEKSRISKYPFLVHETCIISASLYWNILSISQIGKLSAPRLLPFFINLADLYKILYSHCPNFTPCDRFTVLVKPVPPADTFWRKSSRRLLKTLWPKVKLLMMSNFSFGHNVFNFIQQLSYLLWTFFRLLSQCFQSRLLQMCCMPDRVK